VSAWTDYALRLLPACRWLYAHAGLPCWLALAMAAHESGVPPQPDSTLVTSSNPWGVRCFEQTYPCSADDFQIYPSLLAAAEDLPAALGPQRLALVGNPLAFLQDLEYTGWDGPPPNGYAQSVYVDWAPPARAALRALGVDPVTGQPESAPLPSGAILVAPRTIVPAWPITVGVAAVLVGVLLLTWPDKSFDFGRPASGVG